ncbi:MAG: hypothetical protein GF344_02205 [Chitinivibrionales bacterium]|nr:hypothetical protein [Chitinivibrionales bacterium]MBD3355907.1 hypothetical protein [Chitinivibrionales bacterium]
MRPTDRRRFFAQTRRYLENENEEVKDYLVEVLADINTHESIALLKEHLGRGNERIRAMIVSALSPRGGEDLRATFLELLGDPDCRVVANAVEALAAYRDPDIADTLLAYTSHKHHQVRANAIMAVWRYREPKQSGALKGKLREMLYSGDPAIVESALYALGETVGENEMRRELKTFSDTCSELIDNDGAVRRRYLYAVAKCSGEWALDRLLASASVPDTHRRAELVEAIRRALVCGISATQLIGRLVRADFMSREVILRGCVTAGGIKVGAANEELLVSVAEEEAAAVRDARHKYNVVVRSRGGGAVKLLAFAIAEECIERRMNNLIYISTLLDCTGRIGRITRRLHHKRRHVRACAVEVLDNVGNARVNRLLVSLLDVVFDEDVGVGRSAGTADGGRLRGVVAEMENCANEWVRTCAYYCRVTEPDCTPTASQ